MPPQLACHTSIFPIRSRPAPCLLGAVAAFASISSSLIRVLPPAIGLLALPVDAASVSIASRLPAASLPPTGLILMMAPAAGVLPVASRNLWSTSRRPCTIGRPATRVEVADGNRLVHGARLCA